MAGGALWLELQGGNPVSGPSTTVEVATASTLLDPDSWEATIGLSEEADLSIGPVVAASRDVAFVPTVRSCTGYGCLEQSYPTVERIVAPALSAGRRFALPCSEVNQDKVDLAAAGSQLLVVCSESEGGDQGPVSAVTAVYDSANGGKTWSRRSQSELYFNSTRGTPGALPVTVQPTELQMASPQVSYVLSRTGSQERLYVSGDGGRTWLRPTTLPTTGRISLVVAGPSVAYVSVYGQGLWRSTDSGRRWTPVDTPAATPMRLPATCSNLTFTNLPAGTKSRISRGQALKAAHGLPQTGRRVVAFVAVTDPAYGPVVNGKVPPYLSDTPAWVVAVTGDYPASLYYRGPPPGPGTAVLHNETVLVVVNPNTGKQRLLATC